MKTTSTSKPTTALPGFRVIMRGRNKAGVYKRAVRTVHATDYAAAAAKVGPEVTKGVKFDVDFINIFAPLS